MKLFDALRSFDVPSHGIETANRVLAMRVRGPLADFSVNTVHPQCFSGLGDRFRGLRLAHLGCVPVGNDARPLRCCVDGQRDSYEDRKHCKADANRSHKGSREPSVRREPILTGRGRGNKHNGRRLGDGRSVDLWRINNRHGRGHLDVLSALRTGADYSSQCGVIQKRESAGWAGDVIHSRNPTASSACVQGIV